MIHSSVSPDRERQAVEKGGEKMNCDWCKQELTSDEPVTLLAMCEPISQEQAREYGQESFDWIPHSYVITVCLECADLLDKLFYKLIKIRIEADCPFCNPEGLCPTCYAESLKVARADSRSYYT